MFVLSKNVESVIILCFRNCSYSLIIIVKIVFFFFIVVDMFLIVVCLVYVNKVGLVVVIVFCGYYFDSCSNECFGFFYWVCFFFCFLL